jgi:GT2 family glycosyltransferase
MNEATKILISLVNWCHYEDTINCVQALRNQDYRNYEISVVDNASPNNSLKRLKELLPDIHVLESSKNDGYAAGHQINVDYALRNNFDAVWILNSDVELRSNTLTALVEAFHDNSNALYGSVTLASEHPDVVDFGGGKNPNELNNEFSYNTYQGVLYEDLPEKLVRQIQSPEGSSILIPVKIIRKYGFIALDFFMYAEENDYALRLFQKGICSYIVRNSIIVHKNAASFQRNSIIKAIPAYYRRRNYIRLMKTHFGWSFWKSLTNSNSFSSIIKFMLRCILNPSYKAQNMLEYYRQLGTLHGALGIKGKTIKPERFTN